jgi:hypothetical protein
MREGFSALRTIGLAAGAGVLLLLGGCAVPPPYQPANGDFGYTTQQIEDNRFRIAFAGNSVTPRDAVQNYLLYRAAEVTLETGHDWFRLIDQDLERSTRYTGTVDTWHDPFWFDRFDRRRFWRPVGPATMTAYPIDRYTAFADIMVFEGAKPEADVNAYEARDVLRRLEPIVLRAPV